MIFTWKSGWVQILYLYCQMEAKVQKKPWQEGCPVYYIPNTDILKNFWKWLCSQKIDKTNNFSYLVSKNRNMPGPTNACMNNISQ